MAFNRSIARTPTVWERFRGRFRYGLAMQEVSDILYCIFGISIRAYYLVREQHQEELHGDLPADAEGNEVRFLTESDLEALAKIRNRSTENLLERYLSGSRAIGLFIDGSLAACTWFRVDLIPIPNWRGDLRSLGSDEAYLFDAYVLPAYRGRRLVTLVRRRAYEELKRIGRSKFYSITLAFNASSRRFKERLSAKNCELRVQLGLTRWKVIDIRLRTYGSRASSVSCRVLSSRQIIARPSSS